MDENHRRRRLDEPPSVGSDLRFNASQGQDRRFPNPSGDGHQAGSSTTAPSASRGPGGPATYSGGYYQEPQSTFGAALPASTLQYPPGYPQDQRQQQSFTTYNPDLMYNVAQPAQQGAVYESHQFQGRQPAPMQMLSDVAAPYFPNESTSAPGPPGLQHHASSDTSAAYPPHRQSQQGYAGSMTMEGMSQAAPDVLQEEGFQPQSPSMEVAYATYQTALKEVFQNIIDGRLSIAGRSLLEVSEWLVREIGQLGLTVDDPPKRGDRIRLWGEFNTAWLSIFQKQKDMLGLQLQPPQDLMPRDLINKMAKDLIRMCDAIEKYGLVDYQYGIAEEQIIAILTECLDLQESLEGGGASGSAHSRIVPP